MEMCSLAGRQVGLTLGIRANVRWSQPDILGFRGSELRSSGANWTREGALYWGRQTMEGHVKTRAKCM